MSEQQESGVPMAAKVFMAVCVGLVVGAFVSVHNDDVAEQDCKQRCYKHGLDHVYRASSELSCECKTPLPGLPRCADLAIEDFELDTRCLP